MGEEGSLTSSSMIYAMDLGLPGGVSGARVPDAPGTRLFRDLDITKAWEASDASRGGGCGPGLGPGGLGPIGGILRNPFGLHSSRDEASAPATAAAYDQAEQLRSPPRPWSPGAARRLT